MQKSFIVENVEVDLSNLTEKVKEEIEFRLLYSNYNRKSNKKEPFVSKSTQLIS